MAERTLTITFLGNAKPLQQAFSDVETSSGHLTGKISGLGSAMGTVAGVAAGFLGGQILMNAPSLLSGIAGAASGLQLEIGKSATVFGEAIPKVQAWAQANAHAMGLTTTQATSLAAGLADLLIPMGMSRDMAAEMATKTIGLSGALAEWSGGQRTAAEVATILQKAYLGETDGLKELGIAISAADVTARLAEKGQKDLTGAALEQARALAIQELVFEKSGDAQAAFADGAGKGARKQAEFSAAIREFKDGIVLGLQPAIIGTMGFLADHAIPILEGAAGMVRDHVIPQIKEFAGAIADRLGPVLGTLRGWLVDDVLPALRDLGDIVTAHILPMLQSWAEKLTQVLGPALDTLVSAFRDVGLPVLQSLIDLVRDHVIPQLQAWTDKLTGILGPALTGLVGFVRDTLIPGLLAFRDTIRDDVLPAGQAWADQASGALTSAWSGFLGYLRDTVAPWFSGSFVTLLNTLKGAIQAGLADSVGYVLTKWRELKDYWETDLRPAFDNIKTAVEISLLPALVALKLHFEAIKLAGEVLVTWVRDHWGEIWAVIKPVIDLAVAHLELFKSTFADLTNLIVDLVGGDFTGAWQDMQDIVENFKVFFETTIGAITGLFSGMVTLVTTAVADLVTGTTTLLIDAGSQLAGNILSGATTALASAGQALATAFTTSKDAMVTGLGDVGAWLADVADRMVGGFVAQFEATWDALKHKITDKLDPRKWDIPGLSPLPDAMDHGGAIAAGRFTEGFAAGFDDSWPGVAAGVASSISGMAAAAGQGLTTGGSGGTATPSPLGGFVISSPIGSTWVPPGFGQPTTWQQFNQAAQQWITSHPGQFVPPNPFPLPGGTGIQSGTMPRMARGGIVVGDNPSGVEAIVPLERAHEFGFGRGLVGPLVQLTLQALDAQGVESWLRRGGADLIARELHVALRRGGQPGLLGA